MDALARYRRSSARSAALVSIWCGVASSGCSDGAGPIEAAGGSSFGGYSGASGAGGSGGSSGNSTSNAGATSSGGRTGSGGTSATAGTTATGGAGTTGGGVTGGAQNGGAGASAGGSTGAPEVQLIGRMDKSDSTGPRFAWSGSGVVARFEGTSVAANLKGGQQYTVLIDGELKPKLVAKDGANSLASGLTSGAHTVELYRRTEANQGEAQFLGFDFGGGRLLPPPPRPTRRLEIVGDSITCGYGNEGADMNCPFSADTENHYATYGAIAARNLNAELVTVAWSGKGVVCNYGDDTNSCTDPMPTYYDRTLPDRADSRFDFSTYQADAVIINLGTNDFSTTMDPTAAQFEKGYEDLLKAIRSKHAKAAILCTVAPLLSGDDLVKAQTSIASVVKKLNDAGDAKVKTFTLGAVTSSEGFGCDWHPSIASHARMGAELTAVLKSTLNW